MNNSSQQLLIVGLAEAGKSSYIHAVDELLQNPPSSDALRSHGLADDRTYLEGDKARYRAGESLPRTQRNLNGSPPELWFEDPATGKSGRLYLPDVSGEVYRDQWTDRVWENSYAKSLKEVTGILLFARADVAASNAELLGSLINTKKPDQNAKVWDPKKASAQVQLVEVLQFIAVHGDICRPIRISVILSAWDTVLKRGKHAPSPDDFLRSDWALLAQYLESNIQTYSTKVFGVSALGGDKKDMVQLRKVPPTERVQIIAGTDASRDLTLPLRWLLQI